MGTEENTTINANYHEQQQKKKKTSPRPIKIKKIQTPHMHSN